MQNLLDGFSCLAGVAGFGPAVAAGMNWRKGCLRQTINSVGGSMDRAPPCSAPASYAPMTVEHPSPTTPTRDAPFPCIRGISARNRDSPALAGGNPQPVTHPGIG